MTISGIEQTSGSSGYTDFTLNPVVVADGQSFDIDISSGYHVNSINTAKNFYVWIDRNNDGVFHKTDELAYVGSDKNGVSANFSVSGAVDEVLRVRIIASFGIIEDPCGTISFGEVEDYAVKIGDNNSLPNLTYTVDKGTKNQVTFNNTTNDGRINSWLWSFVDGSVSKNSATESPTFTYAADGNYTVTMVAYDNIGAEITSNVFNLDLTTTITSTILTTANYLSVSFDATGSEYPEGSTALWSFGDTESSNSFGPVVHQYAVANSYLVSLTITDAAGTKSDVANMNLQVVDKTYAPQFSISTSNLTATFTNNSLIPNDLNTSMTGAALTWVFGDGATKSLFNVNFDQGTTHTYTSEGTYQVTLKIAYTNDNDEPVSYTSDSVPVTVSATPPAVAYCETKAQGDVLYEYLASASFNGGTAWTNNDDGTVVIVNEGSPIVLKAGVDNSYTFTGGFYGATPYALNYHVWIDINGDGLFGDGDWRNDKSELFVNVFTVGTDGIVTGNITLPTGSEISTTRMRILQYWSDFKVDSIDPCSIYSGEGGEIEDYEITIN